MRESLPRGLLAVPIRSEPDHIQDLVKEPEQEAHYRKRDHDGDHCDDQIEEQREDVDYTLNDRGQVGCEIESQAFHLLLQFVTRSGFPL